MVHAKEIASPFKLTLNMDTIYSTRVSAPTDSMIVPNTIEDNTTILNGYEADDPKPSGRSLVDNRVRDKAGNQKTLKYTKKTKNNRKYQKMTEVPIDNQRGNNMSKTTKITNISTYNVRTLSDDWKQTELVSKATRYNIPIIALQEHRIKKSSFLLNGYKFLLAPPYKNSINATVGGVGFLLSPWAQKCYIDHTIVSKNIMSVSFTSNPIVHVITCHAPHSGTTDDEIASFYEDLTDHVDTIPTHDLIVIAGDLNAHIGRDKANQNAYYPSTNRNGQLLLDFALENSFTIGALKFNKRRTKKVTWKAPNGGLHQIDHILIKSKWQNSLRNCESYISPDVDSDHRIVTAALKMSFRTSIKCSKIKNNWNWKLLKTDLNIKDAFSLTFNNRYESLATNLDDEDIGYHRKCYAHMVEAINHAASETIPPKPKQTFKSATSENPLYLAAQSRRDKAIRESAHRKTRAASKNVKKYSEELEKIERQILDEHVNQAIDEINSAFSTRSDSSAQAWKLVNKVTGRKQKTSSVITGYKSTKERYKAWTDHYSKLLYNPLSVIDTQNLTVDNPLPIDTSPFTAEEYAAALKKLKNTSSLDGIPTSLFKDVDFCDTLLPILNNILLTGIAPDEMLLTGILPIPKGNSTFIPENSRGISMIPVITKLLNRMLLDRIRSHIEPLLRYNQNGFRPERGTREQILAIRRIIEEVLRHNLPAVMTFIDFSKAFDSILRSKLPEILASYGIPSAIIKTILALYTNTKARVITPEGITMEFLTNLGILQGDVLAPFLFIIVLDYILRQSVDKDSSLGLTLHKARSSRYPAHYLQDLDFADDLAAISDSIQDNTKICQSIADTAANFGLHLNMKKTKFMAFNIKDHCNTLPPLQPSNTKGWKNPHLLTGHVYNINQHEIEEVNDFKYLGSYIRTTIHDIQVRKAQAMAALHSMDTCWKSTLSRATKIKLFRATVESVLLYGCETWTMSATLNCVINGFYTRLLRKVLRVSWKSHTKNTVLYGKLNKISNVIRERRLRFAGHIFRHNDQPVHHVLFWTPKHGKRTRGRPTLSYVDVLCTDTSLTVDQLKVSMLDRKLWAEIVKTSSSKEEMP